MIKICGVRRIGAKAQHISHPAKKTRTVSTAVEVVSDARGEGSDANQLAIPSASVVPAKSLALQKLKL
jgi:hypothetical protein